ncbi:MAG: PEP-CTERM sorting domain-containing protein [Kiritimatiellia bacterium]
MKKIILMCVSVALAAATQAASINWTITNIYSASDPSAKVGIGSVTAYLFVTENTTDVSAGITVTTMAAVQAVLDSGDFAGLDDLMSAKAANTTAGIVGGATGLTDFSSGSLTAFAVLVDSDDNYLLVSEGATKSVTFTSATGAKALAFGDQTANSQANWVGAAVPEPTSGLLMLLGVAGLALRRKRA